MSRVEMGIRIDMEKGVAYFGVDEVNKRLAAGGRIKEIRPGGIITTKLGEDEHNVRLTLGGCQLEVVFEDA